MKLLNVAHALTIASGLSFVWMWIWLREDRISPEPRTRILIAFLGGVFAVFISLIFQTFTEELFGRTALATIIIWSLIEESSKFLTARVTSLGKQFADEPIDMLMYMVITALGFATLENFLFILDPLSESLVTIGWTTALVRFIGATLLHVSTSGIIGIFLAFNFHKSRAIRGVVVVIGIFCATLFHSIFNFFTLSYSHNDPLSILGTFGLVWGTIGILLILAEQVKTAD